MKTRRFCPHCGRPVLKSQTKGYAFQCCRCDEDYYKFEVLRKEHSEHIKYLRLVTLYEEKDFYAHHSIYKPYPRSRKHQKRHQEKRNFPIECDCRMCGKMTIVFVKKSDYWKRENQRVLIQDCFPYLSPIQREMIKTGYCSACQKKLFHMNYDENGKRIG